MTGGPATWSLRAMQTFGDNLYVATDNTVTGGTTSDVWSYDDSTGWNHVAQINAPGVMELAVYDNQLYVGDSLSKVSRVDTGTGTVTDVTPIGMKTNNAGIVKLFASQVDGKLHMGTANFEDGFEMWSYDGTTWDPITQNGLENEHNICTWSMVDFDERLLMGTFTLPGYLDGWGIWDYGIRNMEVGDGRLFLGTEIWATCKPIPAPGAIALGALGASLIGWLRRRRTL